MSTDGPVGVTARFEIEKLALTVEKAGNSTGTVSSTLAGIDCGPTCSVELDANTVISLEATPAAGSTFAGWSGGGCAGAGTCQVTLAEATTVTATFEITRYALTITRAGNGSGTITSNPAGVNCGGTCSASFNTGTVVTLTGAASQTSRFDGWSGGGCSGTGATCTVTMSVARTVTARFTHAQLSCSIVDTAFTCASGAIPSINLGPRHTGASCRTACQAAMFEAGMTTGCWIRPQDANCYCRSGHANTTSGVYSGGTCRYAF